MQYHDIWLYILICLFRSPTRVLQRNLQKNCLVKGFLKDYLVQIFCTEDRVKSSNLGHRSGGPGRPSLKIDLKVRPK